MPTNQNVLFEEDGAFKVGTIMSDAGSSLQVEHASGRRVKIKSAQIMLRFDRPGAAELMPAAQKTAEEIDVDFLWECAPQDEFTFTDLALEYFGTAPRADQATALLLKLHASPVHFHRKGRGRYRPAPPEILRAALAAVERKRKQEIQLEEFAAALVTGVLPEPIARMAVRLLVQPDKQSLEFRALERACTQAQLSPERLLLAAGAFSSPRALHRARFQHENFPAGEGFPSDLGVELNFDELPLSPARAFSIDDSTTTEIDDCLSVSRTSSGSLRIGVHIAAPGLAILPASRGDLAARERMSTVYMPGEKITMLPDALVQGFSLDEGREVAALSLYVDLDETGKSVIARESRIEKIRVFANLRHDQLDDLVTEELLNSRHPIDLPSDASSVVQATVTLLEDLRSLWVFTLARTAERERVRGKPEPKFRSDFNFYVDDDSVRIVQRRRDAPLDRIVAEMMILVNSEWGKLLAEHQIPGIYRSQQAGRVRTTTYPLPHQGLGVAQYMWTSSPLRRYVDLVNQRQVIALLKNDKPPFDGQDADLFGLMSAFDARYTAYAEFQTRMERYWCLRWLEQNSLSHVEAVVIREDLVRLADAPFYFRLPQLPELAAGRRILVEVLERDPIALDLRARYIGIAASAVVEVIDVMTDADPSEDSDTLEESNTLADTNTVADTGTPEATEVASSVVSAVLPAAVELTSGAAPP